MRLTGNHAHAGEHLIHLAPFDGECKHSAKHLEFSIDAGYFQAGDRKSTPLNSSHLGMSYAVFCLKKNEVSTPASFPEVTERLLPGVKTMNLGIIGYTSY